MSRNERILLLVLAAVNFTHIMDFMIMMPLGPQLMRTFGIGPTEFGWLVSAYTLTAGVSGFAAAFFMDRFDRKKLMLFIYAGFVLGTLACALASSYPTLMAARILTGVFGGIIGALVFAIVGDAIPMERRATAMGFVMSGFAMASVLGIPFGMYIATHFNWTAPFSFLAFAGVVVWFAVNWFVPSMNAHIKVKLEGESRFKHLQLILSNPNQLLALSLMACLMLGQFLVVPFISPSLVANVGFREDQLFLVYLFGGAVSFFASPIAGRLADRFGKKRIFYIFSVLNAPFLLGITLLGPSPLWLVLVFTSIFFIFTTARNIPATTLITGTVTPQQRGSFMSINTCVQQLSAGLGSLVAGQIVQRDAQNHLTHYPIAGAIGMAFALISMLVAWKLVVLEDKKPEAPIAEAEPVLVPVSPQEGA